MPKSGHVLRQLLFTCAVSIGLVLPAGPASGDEGAELFKKHCQVCHTVDKGGVKRQGPNLWGVIGRAAGRVGGFPYSNGLKNAGWAWDGAAMDKWLENPKGVVSDTYMIYRQKDPAIRRKIVAYLETQKD